MIHQDHLACFAILASCILNVSSLAACVHSHFCPQNGPLWAGGRPERRNLVYFRSHSRKKKGTCKDNPDDPLQLKCHPGLLYSMGKWTRLTRITVVLRMAKFCTLKCLMFDFGENISNSDDDQQETIRGLFFFFLGFLIVLPFHFSSVSNDLCEIRPLGFFLDYARECLRHKIVPVNISCPFLLSQ